MVSTTRSRTVKFPQMYDKVSFKILLCQINLTKSWKLIKSIPIYQRNTKAFVKMIECGSLNNSKNYIVSNPMNISLVRSANRRPELHLQTARRELTHSTQLGCDYVSCSDYPLLTRTAGAVASSRVERIFDLKSYGIGWFLKRFYLVLLEPSWFTRKKKILL